MLYGLSTKAAGKSKSYIGVETASSQKGTGPCNTEIGLFFKTAPGEDRGDIAAIFGTGPLISGIVSGVTGGGFDGGCFVPVHCDGRGVTPPADNQACPPGGPTHQGDTHDRFISGAAGDGFEGEAGLEGDIYAGD